MSDDASSLVTSHFTEDGLWSATIRTDVDLYFVEVFHFLALLTVLNYGRVQLASD